MRNVSGTDLDDCYLKLIREDLVNTQGLHETAAVVARHCAIAIEASRVGVWFLSEDKTSLDCQTLYIRDEDRIENGATLDVGKSSVYFESLSKARIISTDNTRNDKRTLEIALDYLLPDDIQSLLDATICHLGNAQGVLRIEMIGEKRQWSEDEKMFVASAADLISNSLVVDQLAKSEAKHKALFDATNEGIMVFSGPIFVDVNPAVCDIFGGCPEDIIGKSPIDFSPEFQSDGKPSGPTAMNYVQKCLQGEPQNFEWTHLRLDGTEFFADITLNSVRLENEDTLFALIRDITDKKAERAAQQVQEEIKYRAAHDSLTGLLNREQLHIHVDNLISNGQKNQNQSFQIALMLFDLNRFKEINDTLGHTTGDQVLVKLSNLLKEPIENVGGELFRLGGDEFVAVFDNQSCSEPFKSLEKMLTQSMKTTLEIEDIRVEMGASIGISLYPDNGTDSHELLRCADVAMYDAKTTDGTSSWYDPKSDLNNKRRLAIMLELGSAIRNNDLTLFFQPRINTSSGAVTGCEALLRWEHTDLGLIPPIEFIPLAEMTELIHPLTAWVLNSTLLQINRLKSLGYDIPVAMNISTRNLTDSHFVDTLKKLVTSGKINPRLLEIEITESAIMNHPARALQNLERIDKLGLSIAVDDFGTGYSSLNYLKKLPLDTLKIDRSFVSEMISNESDSLIVDSVINLAHNFSFTVVAEGVEDKETLDALASKNCDQAQGYYIAKPMPADEFEAWLEEFTGGVPAYSKVA